MDMTRDPLPLQRENVSEKDKQGFPFCGGSLVAVNKDGYSLPRFIQRKLIKPVGVLADGKKTPL